MRILVTGSRGFTNRMLVELALRDVGDGWGVPQTVVHGAARGADDIASEVALIELGWRVEPYPADWKQYGKRAGFIRNQEMVDTKPDVCLGFFKRGAANKGTMDCVTRALKAGIPIRTYWG